MLMAWITFIPLSLNIIHKNKEWWFFYLITIILIEVNNRYIETFKK
jgi:hypothetical protein